MGLTSWIAEVTHPSIVIGIDHDRSVLSDSVLTSAEKLQADLNVSIPLSNESVDLITAIDVIEHLVEPAIFVREAYRVLKPEGYLVIDTPNLASWHNVFALVCGFQPFSGPNITTMQDSESRFITEMRRLTYSWSQEGDYVRNRERRLSRHIVVMTYKALLRLLDSQGFRVEIVRGFGYYPFPHPMAKILQRLDRTHVHHIVLKARKPRQL